MILLNSIQKPMKALLLSPWIAIICIYFFLTVIIPLPSEMVVKYINEINMNALFIGIYIYYFYFLAIHLLSKNKTKVETIIMFNIKTLAYAIFIFIFFQTINLVVRHSGISVIQDTNFWHNISYMSIYLSFYIGYAIKKINYAIQKSSQK